MSGSTAPRTCRPGLRALAGFWRVGLAALLIVPALVACRSNPAEACDAWRSHLHGGAGPEAAVEAVVAVGDQAFADALIALAAGKASPDQVNLVFETCATIGRPLVDSPHTGEGD